MVKLKIEGMTCDHCVQHVKTALADVASVAYVQVDLPSGEATVQGSACVEALIKAVEAEGYSARLI